MKEMISVIQKSHNLLLRITKIISYCSFIGNRLQIFLEQWFLL